MKCLTLTLEGEATGVELSTHARADVASYYKSPMAVQCGFQLKIPIQNKVSLCAQITDKLLPIFEFSSLLPQLQNTVPSYIVIDNFYKDPDAVRAFALRTNMKEHPQYHKGRRSDETYLFPGLKERFEKLIGRKIKDWTRYGTNGCFQYCIAGDQLVYHTDQQEYAGVLFLTPDAPASTGTALFRSKHTKSMHVTDKEHPIVFKNGFLDSTEFELVDRVGNVYNRLVLFDAKCIHAATEYFGTDRYNGRLFQLFFFDLESSS